MTIFWPNRKKWEQRQNLLNDRKTRTVSKVETMVAEMNIEIMRYQAFMDDPLPEYLTPEFLDDFKILPTSFYMPDGPEKFQLFIQRWGTHVVKSVKLGGKFRYFSPTFYLCNDLARWGLLNILLRRASYHLKKYKKFRVQSVRPNRKNRNDFKDCRL